MNEKYNLSVTVELGSIWKRKELDFKEVGEGEVDEVEGVLNT